MPISEELSAQITELSVRYNVPIRATITLPEGNFDPVTKPDRIGEVCMVIRRPNGRLLTASKTFYPAGIYRLPTGGIAPDEPIESALLRETREETGLNVRIRRFLAAIEYLIPLQHSQGDRSTATSDLAAHHRSYQMFCTFAFLLDELNGTLTPLDSTEQIAEFREIVPAELPTVATTLEQVQDDYDTEIRGRWRNWGMFRAIVHRVVYAALSDEAE